MNIYHYIAGFALSLFLTSGLSGQTTPLKPVVQTEIESQRLQVQNDGENAYFLFSEAVVLEATNMRLECDKLEVFATRQAEDQTQICKFGSIREIIATGNVRIEQQERTATCQKAVVKPNEERIVLSGNPVVVQPGGRLVTYNPQDEIILDRGNGRISIDAKGPRKLRLTSSAINDLGFERELPVPTPEDAESAPEATASDEESEENNDESAAAEPAAQKETADAQEESE